MPERYMKRFLKNIRKISESYAKFDQNMTKRCMKDVTKMPERNVEDVKKLGRYQGVMRNLIET